MAGYTGLSLLVPDGDGYVSVDCEPTQSDDVADVADVAESAGAEEDASNVQCQIFTSLVPGTYGYVPASVVAPTTSFDATLGWDPDEIPVHVAVRPGAAECPAWVLSAAHADLAQRGQVSEDGTRWVYVEEGDEGRSTSRDGDQCCWEHPHYRVRSWVEMRCPGTYGVDVELTNVEQRCGACMTPPRGCG